MDLQLNITGGDYNVNEKRVEKNSKKNQSDEKRFSVQFSKNTTGKAFVARKKSTTITSSGPVKKSNVFLKKSTNDLTEKTAKTVESFKNSTVIKKPNLSPNESPSKSSNFKRKPFESDHEKNVMKKTRDVTVKSPDSKSPTGPSDIVSRIFNPDRQKRIENLLKNTKSNSAEQTGDQQNESAPVKFGRKNPGNQMFRKDFEEKAPVMGQRFVKPIFEKVFSGAPMASIGLHPHAVKNVKDLLDISELTSVQQKAIPKILENRDVLVRSQTGSGKTLAYALPIVEKLHSIRPKLTRESGIQALVIVPTRELAIQSYELFIKLLKPFTWIVPGYLSGGEKRKSEKARLRKGINILVGTPGRLVDHILNTESFKLDTVKWFVLDEGDRLFELGYEKDVGKIVDALHNKPVTNDLRPVSDSSLEKAQKNSQSHIKFDETKAIGDNSTAMEVEKTIQTIMLSATLTPAVEKLAGITLKNPLFIDNAEENTETEETGDGNTFAAFENNDNLVIPSTVDLSYMIVPPKLRLVTLSGLLAKECKTGKEKKILIFISTQEMVDFHHDMLREALTKKILDDDDENFDNEQTSGEDAMLTGVRFFKLHGALTQVERSGVFKAFKECKSGVLITTDVAARGLDVPKVDLVVQYTAPQMLADFVHRVGRTARAGRSGRAILFIASNEMDYIRILEEKRIRISQGDMDPLLGNLLVHDSEARNIQEAASNLQHLFEKLIASDRELHDKACKAFASWLRYYSAFPRDFKHIFNIRVAHMGHYAKSFCLKEPPKSVAKGHMAPKPVQPQNKLSYKNLDDQKKGKKRQFETKKPHQKFNMKKTICLTTSEYDSGMFPMKRMKK